jgi:hypothetical protein
LGRHGQGAAGRVQGRLSASWNARRPANADCV